MDAADPLRAARPEEAGEKPKGAESQDDGYETSNSGEARRGEVAPEPPPPPQPAEPPPPLPAHLPAPLHDAHYEPLMRHYPSPAPQPYRQFEQEQDYQHFPFPKYSEPYDMSQHQGYKRDEEMYNGVKRECEDPYSFVEEEAMSLMLNAQHHQHPQLHHDPHQMMHHQMMINQPKKRGRKKKIKDENGMEIKTEPGMEGPPRPVKERKKHDRFNGMSEEEVARRTLPDHLAENLDIIIIGINPGLFAAYKGHHYAGPGNHFWKCLYLSGLTREQMSADEDYKLLNFGIGFTNMVPRATKGSADLTRREIKEGSAALLEKLQTFRPKVAVFNGKLIYEVFSGKKDFCFGKQPDTIAGTNTYMWVMPSSSARCAQLPRAADKVPFYAALKKFRDYLNGLLPHLDETELVFPDNTARRPHEEMEIRRLTMEPEPGDTIILEDGTEVPLKKKRGRPKKVKLENGEVVPPTPRAPRAPRPPPALDAVGDQPPKKKRGRPKKIRPEEQQFLLQQQQAQQQQQQQTQQQQQQVQQQQQQQQVGGGLLQNQLGGLGLPHEQQYMSGFGLDNPLYMQPQPEHDNTHSHYYQPNNANAPLEQGMDMSGMSLSRPYGSPGAASGGPAAGYSPRPVYHSPRSQGYSPQPPRHTPQPQNQFPPSPGVYSGGGGRALPPLPARSPLYASPPAPPYPQGSPAPQSHRPQFARSPQYSRSPAPPRPYSRSPAPAGAAPGAAGSFGASSPAPLHSYTPSPQHTPYSQHESPVPNNNQPHYLHTETGSTGAGSAGSGSGSYGGELGEGLPPLSPVGGAVEAPPSPAPALDFSPPRDPPPPSPPPPSDMHVGSNSNSSLSDYNKNSQPGSDMSPAGVNVGSVPTSFPPAMYDSDARLPYHLHSPHMDKEHYHYQQDQGSSGVGDSPRLDQMHQHPSMYPTNFNRATPEGGETGFRPPDTPHTPHHHPGSPVEYGSNVKPKSQDVASKSLSGLESLVDQIPSIAEGPAGGAPAPAPADQPAAPVAALPEYAPALYGPYSAYGGAAYPNNGYGSAFVGYGGGWGGGLMRAAPGYLPEWQYGYAPPVPPSYPYNPTYYNGYTPPQQTHYLSAPPLLELHKNGEGAGVPGVPSVPFGSFC